jgi:tetratricopeptide (TPR) repeat protein
MTMLPIRPRPLLLLIAAVLVAAGSHVLTPASAPAAPVAIGEPLAPAGADVTEDAEDPEGRLSLPGQIAFWSERVRRQPDDYLSMTQLALAQAALARRTADLAGFERSDELLTRALAINPRHGATLRARAVVAFALHDFGAARSAAELALERDPRDTGAIALLADARLELGDLQGAAEGYGRLAELASGPAVDARLARFSFLTGDGEAALRLSRAARDAALADPSIGELAFYQAQLGELARLSGDAALARAAFEAAVDVAPRDLAGLVGLARVRAFEGDRRGAIQLLRTATAIAPQPETLALLGDLLALEGDSAGAAEAHATVGYVGRLGLAAGQVYDRQLLLYELDHGGAGEELLEAARASLAARPDAAAHDLVAWALHRLGRDDEARLEVEQALASGSLHPRLRFHAGAIAAARGETAAAAPLLSEALAAGPGLDPIERQEAAGLLAVAGGD